MNKIQCLRCGTVLEDYGTQTVRIGGVGGAWQDTLPFQVHICPKCGKIELTATKRTARILFGRKGFRKCIKCGRRIPLASEECQYCGAEQKEKNE